MTIIAHSIKSHLHGFKCFENFKENKPFITCIRRLGHKHFFWLEPWHFSNIFNVDLSGHCSCYKNLTKTTIGSDGEEQFCVSTQEPRWC